MVTCLLFNCIQKDYITITALCRVQYGVHDGMIGRVPTGSVYDASVQAHNDYMNAIKMKNLRRLKLHLNINSY